MYISNDDSMAASRAGGPETYTLTVDRLERLDARLRRLEERLEPALQAIEGAAAGLGAATDSVDAILAKVPDFDERLNRIADLAASFSRPPVLDGVGQALEGAQSLPASVALLGDLLDEWMARANAEGVNVGALVETLDGLLMATLKLVTDERFRSMVQDSILTVESFIPLEALARGAQTSLEKPQAVGAFGLLRALRDPDIQRALSQHTDQMRRRAAEDHVPRGGTLSKLRGARRRRGGLHVCGGRDLWRAEVSAGP